jgi:hypothetical protein
MKKHYRLLFLVLLAPILVTLLAGCESIDHDKKKEGAVVAPPPVEKPKYIFHRVFEGETMASIAKWYSGNEALWYELKEHNPGLDPYRLKKGDVIKVPVDMGIVHSEQPNYSTQQKTQKVIKKGAGKGSGVPSDAPDDVFGPK